MTFNVNVNDLQDNLFADITTLYESCKRKDLINLQSRLNTSLSKVNNWPEQNSLVANVNKTRCLMCASKRFYNYHSIETLLQGGVN